MRIFAIVLAAGRGERFGSDKVRMPLGDRPLWRWSFEAFRDHPAVEGVGLVAAPGNVDAIREAAEGAAFVVAGGSNRQESCLRGVEAVPETADAVLVHDAARPLVSEGVIRSVIDAIQADGAAAACLPVADTLRNRDGDGYVLIDRESAVAMQTPQGARRDWLLDAHRRADRLHTDEMALLEAAGYRCRLVHGTALNFKVTTRSDLILARAMLGAVERRSGLGYDVHRFSADPSRPLVLGGVRFPEGPGLEGHSDADVLIHAVVDAILGALALGDIGQHFPNSDPQWRNEPSLTFLAHARDAAERLGWRIENVDATLIAERPKVMARAEEIRRSIAGALDIDAARVSVKATTNEGLGSIGRGEGIAALATATLALRPGAEDA